MRRLTWFLMLAFVFAMPWEYSLNLGDGIGDIARVLGLLVLVCAIPTVLQAGQLRTPTLVHALTLAVFLWFCLTVFWSVDTTVTLTRVRGYFQELMIIWLLWEFAADERDRETAVRLEHVPRFARLDVARGRRLNRSAVHGPSPS